MVWWSGYWGTSTSRVQRSLSPDSWLPRYQGFWCRYCSCSDTLHLQMATTGLDRKYRSGDKVKLAHQRWQVVTSSKFFAAYYHYRHSRLSHPNLLRSLCYYCRKYSLEWRHSRLPHSNLSHLICSGLLMMIMSLMTVVVVFFGKTRSRLGAKPRRSSALEIQTPISAPVTFSTNLFWRLSPDHSFKPLGLLMWPIFWNLSSFFIYVE